MEMKMIEEKMNLFFVVEEVATMQLFIGLLEKLPN